MQSTWYLRIEPQYLYENQKQGPMQGSRITAMAVFGDVLVERNILDGSSYI